MSAARPISPPLDARRNKLGDWRNVRAISIRQPWAWAILYADKRVENRTWYCDYRGPIFIHAGLTVDRDGLTDLEAVIREVPEPRPKAYLGALIGRAVLVDCVRPDDVAFDQTSWAMGPWCLVLEDVEPLSVPLPCKGMLGIFRPSIQS